ncbi:MAG: nucleotide exchange factor GrpE [Vampirovibrionales bacterium]
MMMTSSSSHDPINPFKNVTETEDTHAHSHTEVFEPQNSEGVEILAPQPENGEASWQVKYQDLLDQHLRLRADFDNFRKRRQQEMDAARKYDGQYMLMNLLSALDNYDRAMSYMREDSDAKTLYQTLQMLTQGLHQALEQSGVTRLSVVNQPFNAQEHEAVGTVPSQEVAPDTVIQETLGGYKLADKLIRPAQVLVAVAPEVVATEA